MSQSHQAKYCQPQQSQQKLMTGYLTNFKAKSMEIALALVHARSAQKRAIQELVKNSTEHQKLSTD